MYTPYYCRDLQELMVTQEKQGKKDHKYIIIVIYLFIYLLFYLFIYFLFVCLFIYMFYLFLSFLLFVC